MTLRKTLFWLHLSAGLGAGLIIALLGLTGAILAFEPQILDARRSAALSDAPALDLDALVAAARAAGAPDGATLSLGNGNQVITVQSGRNTMFLDPGTGARIDDPAAGLQSFFHSVEQMHRWLLPVFDRDTGAAITGAANLVFLFVLVSGLFLWLPRVWKWRVLRNILFFRRGLPGAWARDYNWHHVLGIWSVLPMALIVLSGVVMSYGWANATLYGIFGETAPQGRPGAATPVSTGALDLAVPPQGYAELAASALQAVPAADNLSLILLPDTAPQAIFLVDTSPARKPTDMLTVHVDRQTGATAVAAPQASPASKARSWLRFVHTGEVYGWPGQLVAMLASLTAVVLTWTGIAQAWRRLVQPVLRRHAHRA